MIPLVFVTMIDGAQLAVHRSARTSGASVPAYLEALGDHERLYVRVGTTGSNSFGHGNVSDSAGHEPTSHGEDGVLFAEAPRVSLPLPRRGAQDTGSDSLERDWPNGPCEDMFRHYAEHTPARLTEYLNSNVANAGLLIRAIRVAGELDVGRRSLIRLLDHGHPAVQEAAIYALESDLTDEVRSKLQAIARDATRRDGVREAAKEALDP